MRQIIQLTIYLISFVLFTVNETSAQGFIFGFKGGPTLGLQKWNNFERDPLFTFHGDLFIESLPVEGKFSLFFQAGYHNRGSAIRTRAFTGVGLDGTQRNYPARTTKFLFRNGVLAAGAKQKFEFGETSKVYYSIGIRGEYTIKTNLSEFEDINIATNNLFYPDDSFVQKFIFGPTVGGGIEFPFSEYVVGFLELNVMPDFSNQYSQPPIQNVSNPNSSNNTNISERLIRNNSLELTVGVGFLRKVEYIDDNLF